MSDLARADDNIDAIGLSGRTSASTRSSGAVSGATSAMNGVTSASPSSPTANVVARPPADDDLLSLLFVFASRRHAENIDGQDSVLQKLRHGFQLLLVLVHERQRGVGAGKAVRMNLAVDIAGIVGIHDRHVTIEQRMLFGG